MRRLILFILLALMPLPILAQEKGSSIVFFLKGYRSEIQGKYEEAMDNYRAALRLDPDSREIRTEIALLYIKKGDVAGAEQLLAEALSIDEDNRNVLILLASIYATRGETQKAKGMYEKCIALNPEDTEAHLFLGPCIWRTRNTPRP